MGEQKPRLQWGFKEKGREAAGEARAGELMTGGPRADTNMGWFNLFWKVGS